MMMLSRDSDMFHSRFCEAEAFLCAADLRFECYDLACRTYEVSPYRSRRLKELLHAPACREQWFVVMLRNDAKDNGIEEFLLEVGL